MPKKQINNKIPNRICINLMTCRIGKQVMDHVKPEKKNQIFMQKAELMTYREDFINTVIELRNRHKIPNQGFDSFDKCVEWAEKMELVDIMIYEDDVEDILKHFKIKKRWLNIIEYFIFFNKIDAPHLLPKSVEIQVKPDLNHELGIFIKIQPETTLPDIENWWEVVKMWQGIAVGNKKVLDGLVATSDEYLEALKHLPEDNKDVYKQLNKKDRQRTRLPIYKRAYDLKKQGMTAKEIAKLLKKENTNLSCTYVEVAEYVRQFKKAIKESRLD